MGGCAAAGGRRRQGASRRRQRQAACEPLGPRQRQGRARPADSGRPLVGACDSQRRGSQPQTTVAGVTVVVADWVRGVGAGDGELQGRPGRSRAVQFYRTVPVAATRSERRNLLFMPTNTGCTPVDGVGSTAAVRAQAAWHTPPPPTAYQEGRHERRRASRPATRRRGRLKPAPPRTCRRAAHALHARGARHGRRHQAATSGIKATPQDFPLHLTSLVADDRVQFFGRPRLEAARDRGAVGRWFKVGRPALGAAEEAPATLVYVADTVLCLPLEVFRPELIRVVFTAWQWAPQPLVDNVGHPRVSVAQQTSARSL